MAPTPDCAGSWYDETGLLRRLEELLGGWGAEVLIGGGSCGAGKVRTLFKADGEYWTFVYDVGSEDGARGGDETMEDSFFRSADGFCLRGKEGASVKTDLMMARASRFASRSGNVGLDRC